MISESGPGDSRISIRLNIHIDAGLFLDCCPKRPSNIAVRFKNLFVDILTFTTGRAAKSLPCWPPLGPWNSAELANGPGETRVAAQGHRKKDRLWMTDRKADVKDDGHSRTSFRCFVTCVSLGCPENGIQVLRETFGANG